MSTSTRTVRLEVPDGDLLDRLAGRPLPLPVTDEARDMVLFRDVYFDTPGAELELKPAVVRLRHRSDGRRTLRVAVRDHARAARTGSGGDGPDEVDPASRRGAAEAEVGDGEPSAIFQGDSGPARLLRAVIDPDRLEPAFEVETLRRVRRGSLEGSGGAIEVAYDTLTVRREGLSATLQEITVRAREGVDLAPLLRSLEEEPGVRITLAEPLRRARDLLAEAEVEALERDVRSAREVAVVARSGHRIALCRAEEGTGLRVPRDRGSGEAAGRRLVADVFGGHDARLRLLGTSPGGLGRPALEVWLADDVGRGTEAAGAAPSGEPASSGARTSGETSRVVWLPLTEVLAAVGSGALRESRTLAALEVVTRSDIAPVAAEAEVASYGGHRALERAVPASPGEGYDTRIPPEHLLNAELSRLAFDERILAFAESDSTPLLERLRFLAMFGERQDDFFMTRVAGFKEELLAGPRRTLDGLTPHEQLDLIGVRARAVARRAQRLLADQLLPALAEQGIEIVTWADLDDSERARLRTRYGTDAEAVLTPMAADASHPFPRIRNLRPAIGAVVRLPVSNTTHFAAVELPGELPRFLPLGDGRRLVPLEELVVAQLPDLFTGLEVESAHLFRLTRSAETQLDETLVADVLEAVRADVAHRPFRAPVRLEVEASMPRPVRQLILNELRYESPSEPWSLGPRDVYVVDGVIDLASLEEIIDLAAEDGSRDAPAVGPGTERAAELRFPSMERARPFADGRSVFDLVAEADRLIHFPYDDFSATTERFIREAAEDPDVVALKVTLYRTNAGSEVVKALSRAREQGKDAVALIEIKASFDEERNIAWAKSLSAAGVHVVFSPLHYKVHAKAALAVRREGDELRRYGYIGTGNLNAATARSYTDVGLLTADPAITEELQSVFNILTGYSSTGEFGELLVSPFNMRERLLALLDREIGHARAGRPARLRGQLNGLADRRMIGKLYEASRAGVEIDMAVREICALRPGVPGLSENIRVVSLVGRLLQHARIFELANGGDPEYYIGSADWRPRNLSRRVEVITPVRHPPLMARLGEIMDGVLNDDQAWVLRPDGSHVRGDQVAGGGVQPGASSVNVSRSTSRARTRPPSIT